MIGGGLAGVDRGEQCRCGGGLTGVQMGQECKVGGGISGCVGGRSKRVCLCGVLWVGQMV